MRDRSLYSSNVWNRRVRKADLEDAANTLRSLSQISRHCPSGCKQLLSL